MTTDTEQLASEIGELLAASMIDPKIKNSILENLDTMPENLVFKLKDALENERAELDTVMFDIELFLKEQDERWSRLEADQTKAARNLSDELFDKIKDQT